MDHVISVDLTDLSDDDIAAVVTCARDLGAHVEELDVEAGVEDLAPYVPIVVAVLTPFLEQVAKSAQPGLAKLLSRIFRRRKGDGAVAVDRGIRLVWDPTVEAHQEEAVAAIALVDFGDLPDGAVLGYVPEARRWRHRRTGRNTR